MTKKNIILTGMPTSGKSTIGVIVAKILGMDFIDTDILIQQREGKKLSEIIEENGTDKFLKCEEEALLGLDVSNCVIATGGSAVYSDKAMKHLKNDALVAYLKVDKKELNRRLKDVKGRGVVLRDGQSLDDMYETRVKLYERYADLTISEEGLTLEDTVEKLISELGERL
ncbi:MAG: shikimate kinase [Lachnospiraceae bacterium]|nr:shikimate kinase [Lachnospiraceae bacterium]